MMGDFILESYNVEQTVEWLSWLRLTRDYADTIREHGVNGAKLLEVDNVLLDEWCIRSGADRLKILQSVLDVREKMAAARRFHLGLTIEDEYMDSGMMLIRRGLDPIGEEDEEEDEEESTSTPLMNRIKGAQNTESVPVMQRRSVEEKPEVSRALVNGTVKTDTLPGYEESERRISRLVRFEVEMTQLQKAYEMLEMAGAKREKLEMAMRARLEAEVKRLRDANQLLQAEMECQMTASSANLDDANCQITERDQTIVNLSSRLATAEAGCNQLQLQLLQCQSQLADKTAELESVKQQLQNAIDEIETLSDDLMKKNALADRVSSLQEALATLHEATEKREVLEETLRLRLEEEIRNLKKERQGNWRQSAPVMSPSGITMNGQLASSQDDVSGRPRWHSPSPVLGNGGVTHAVKNSTTDHAVSELDLAVKSLQAVVRQKEQEVEMLEKRTAATQDWLPPEPPFRPPMPPMTAPVAVNLPIRSSHPLSVAPSDSPRSRPKNHQTPQQQRSSFYGTTFGGLIFEGETLEV